MIRFTPAIRLALGLVVLTISLLILAQSLGLTPNTEREQLTMRQQLSETLLSQMSLAIVRGDNPLLQQLMKATKEQNSDINSIALRRLDGTLVVETGRHDIFWKSALPKESTPTHIRLPVLINGSRRATFEMSFKPIREAEHSLLHLPKFVLLLIFIAVSGFIGFWFYIKRVLKHLDPSAVVPARVRNALNILSEGVLILDRREQIVLANTSLVEHLNRPEKQLLGKKASQLGWALDPDQEAKEFPWLSAQMSGVRQVGVRLLMANEEGKQSFYRVNAVPILDAKGMSQGTIAVFDDVTELEEKSRLLEDMVKQLAVTQVAIEVKNRELSFLATRDPLTNCFNRRALYEQLDGKFDGARASDSEFCCIMADVDFFKKVNDTYGHSVGDEVIKMTANCLIETVRDMDIVARFGGEEFCVILPGTSLEQARLVAERCREKIERQVTQGVKVTSSFGVSSVRSGAKTSGELIQQADEALYFSKQQGRNRVSCWDATMETIIAND